MAESTANRKADQGQPQHPEGQKLAELRTLLFGTEKTQIEHIRERLDNPQIQAREVSQVLPAAIRIRASEDEDLVPALQSTVEEILQQSVENNPESLVQILFPIMGRAIRRSIRSALRDMLRNMERTLDLSLSPRGIRWRLEALRSGRPFPEVVLLHTLDYSVEQIFLIHRKTGLILQHVVADAVPSHDPDLISAMLTAIQDFAKDSFEVSEALDTLEFGELCVWIEPGPLAVAASVIRGDAPREVRVELSEALERIHRRFQEHLANYEGDNTPFEATRPLLQRCLHVKIKEEEEERGRPWMLWAIASLVLLLLLGWGLFNFLANRRLQDYVDRLQAEPGIVVTEASIGWGKLEVDGLRDPLAVDPASLLGSSIQASDVRSRWEPYAALHPQILAQRAAVLLQPPASVQLGVEAGTLQLSGTATQAWVAETRKRWSAIPGLSRLDESGLEVAEAVRAAELQAALQSIRLPFEVRSSRIVGQQSTLTQVNGFLRELNEMAEKLDTDYHIRVVGHTDPAGSDRFNRLIGRERAEAVLALLTDRAEWGRLSFETASSIEEGLESNERSVRLEVIPQNSASQGDREE